MSGRSSFHIKCDLQLIIHSTESGLGEESYATPSQEIAWLRKRCARLEQENARLLSRAENENDFSGEPLASQYSYGVGETENDIWKVAPALHNLSLGLGEEADSDHDPGRDRPFNVPSDGSVYGSIQPSMLKFPDRSPGPIDDTSHPCTKLLSRFSTTKSRYLVSFHFERLI